MATPVSNSSADIGCEFLATRRLAQRRRGAVNMRRILPQRQNGDQIKCESGSSLLYWEGETPTTFLKSSAA